MIHIKKKKNLTLKCTCTLFLVSANYPLLESFRILSFGTSENQNNHKVYFLWFAYFKKKW